MSKTTKNILLATAPMYGHAIPLLELGRKLVKFHPVTFAVSMSLLEKIRSEYKDTDHGPYGPIRFIGVPEAVDEGKPGISSDNLRRLFAKILPGMREFFLSLSPNNDEANKTKPEESTTSLFGAFGNRVDVVIAENFIGGPASVLRQRGIPYYLFNTARAWMTQVFLTLDDEVPVNSHIPENLFFACKTSGKKIFDPNFHRSKDLLMENCKTVQLAEGIIFHSFRSADKEFLPELMTFPAMDKVKLFFVGPLMTETTGTGDTKSCEFHRADRIRKWLDEKPPNSVVYVSFGSVAVPGPEQIGEIGKALLQLKVPFIWSLSAAHHVHIPQEIQDTVNASKRGEFMQQPYWVLPWAPQKSILSHPAIGVFVSHCGWNSTLEALTYGVPIVAWPVFGDQMMNAEWLEKESAGKLIHPTAIQTEKTVLAHDIAAVVAEVGQPSQRGKENRYRIGARKWQKEIQEALSPNGSSTQDILKLAQL